MTSMKSNLAADYHRHELYRQRKWIAENTVTNLRLPSMGSWSWQNIQKMYELYGKQLETYRDIADRFELQLPITKEQPLKLKPGDVITTADAGRHAFVGAFARDVRRINQQISVLDTEIARRNNLIGVMG